MRLFTIHNPKTRKLVMSYYNNLYQKKLTYSAITAFRKNNKLEQKLLVRVFSNNKDLIEQFANYCEHHKIKDKSKEKFLKFLDKNKNLSFQEFTKFCYNFRACPRELIKRLSDKNCDDLVKWIKSWNKELPNPDKLMEYEKLSQNFKGDLRNCNLSIAFVRIFNQLLSSKKLIDIERIEKNRLQKLFREFALCFYVFHDRCLDKNLLKKLIIEVDTEIKEKKLKEKELNALNIYRDFLYCFYEAEIKKKSVYDEIKNELRYEKSQPLVDLALIKTVIRKYVDNSHYSSLNVDALEAIEKEFFSAFNQQIHLPNKNSMHTLYKYKRFDNNLIPFLDALAVHIENVKLKSLLVDSSILPEEMGKLFTTLIFINHIANKMNKDYEILQQSDDLDKSDNLGIKISIDEIKGKTAALTCNWLYCLNTQKALKSKVMDWLYNSQSNVNRAIKQARSKIKNLRKQIEMVEFEKQIKPKSNWIDKLTSFFSWLLGIGRKKSVNQKELKQKKPLIVSPKELKQKLAMEEVNLNRQLFSLEAIQKAWITLKKGSFIWAIRSPVPGSALLKGKRSFKKGTYTYCCLKTGDPYKLDNKTLMAWFGR